MTDSASQIPGAVRSVSSRRCFVLLPSMELKKCVQQQGVVGAVEPICAGGRAGMGGGKYLILPITGTGGLPYIRSDQTNARWSRDGNARR